MSKTIDTLLDDVDDLFRKPHTCDDERVNELGRAIAEMVKRRLAEDRSTGGGTLRMSNVGRPARQLYYEINRPDAVGKEDIPPAAKRKFLTGDIWELILLFLAEEAGHTVENKQGKVKVNGVSGSLDAVIDGVVVDVKSASTQAIKKFQTGGIEDNDSFGYMEQLAGYSEGMENRDGAFWAIDKTLGNMVLYRVPGEKLRRLDVPARIDYLREKLASPELPERCYEPVDDGKSGNLALSVGCSYCPFKFDCWSDANGGVGVRTFLYASGPKHLVHVANEPKVPELTF